MTLDVRRRFRCGVYTRKSSEEGLEQSFNSLDAQHEACEAYIRSQRHEGWKSIGIAYDDGGFSGGSMDRPGLQQLLADIEADRIDIVVVYKVDRLTRSLMDFAKIIETFDRKGVSFVSVTQQFSTTTSMGRLTLNMLLSFAQFEREVTGERIRDKIAASKRKGLWMGGLPPIGYDPQDRTLKVNPAEAATVMKIFELYRRLGNIRLVKQEVDRLGLRTKRREWSNGKVSGDTPFTRGHLHQLLANPIYAGFIAHKGQLHQGQHQAIIEPQIWREVQDRLKGAKGRQRPRNSASSNLLSGLLFDANKQRMIPSYASKGARRYCYYVSRNLIVGSGNKETNGWRIPTRDLDALVVRGLRDFLLDKARLVDCLGMHLPSIALFLDRAEGHAEGIHDLSSDATRKAVEVLLKRVEVSDSAIGLVISSAGLSSLLRADPSPDAEQDIDVRIPTVFRRRSGEMRIMIRPDGPEDAADPYPALIRTIERAQSWFARLSSGETIKQLANNERVTTSFISRTVRLAFLAPDITLSILEGRQPEGLNVTRLLQDSDQLPLAWSDQRSMLGFPTHTSR